ncbi:MAG: tetratricopeptide repeat protein [Verrucomicrobiota bacterium]
MRLPCFSLPAVLRVGIGMLTVGALALFCSVLPGCQKSPETASTANAGSGAGMPAAQPAAVAELPVAASTDCRSCHEGVYKSWSGSHHALAHRTVDEKSDADAFGQVQEFKAHGIDYRMEWKDGKPVFSEKREGASPAEHFVAEYVLGHTPLRQYVVPIGNGRFQAADLTFDPAKKEWFNVFGDERRQPGEWGHWRGRGMNWNSMCAHCHMTGYKKNYDAARDVYATTWREHGVGCAQCHAMPADHATNPKKSQTPDAKSQTPGNDLATFAANRKQSQETCAPCHARNELLTGDVRPGVAYNDYYRLTLPTEASVFYPDGQMRDEDFNYTSLLTSRMGGKAGVTCLDCHDPHSGKTILPAQNNALCMQCHGGTGGRLNAPVIEPVTHSHHALGSTGNQCISCHMPTTPYMQRDPRHDHGFTKPDPLLTKELGIPNACNRCHTDKPVDWAIEHSERWYGKKLESRQRERARVVAAAQAHAPEAGEKLLALIAGEEIPAWKATLMLLTRSYAPTNPRVLEAARNATRDADPMVRSAGAQILASVPSEVPSLRPLLNDSSRLVRLDASWPLSPELPENSANRKELDAYLAVSADQPAGRMRIGQDFFNRGRPAEAEAQLRKATEWDPNSAGFHDALGIILNELNRPDEAAASLWRAARIDTANPQAAFNAALAFAGARKLADAELAFREAIRRDPRFDRAFYNLGLLLAQTNRVPDGIAALESAEQIAPRVADYPYARATLLWQRGDRAGAVAAARKALAADPTHAQAQALLRQAGG